MMQANDISNTEYEHLLSVSTPTTPAEFNAALHVRGKTKPPTPPL